MIHLEVRNKPQALHGRELIHRNIECLAFEYNENNKELAIYESYQEWVDNVPSYRFCYVTHITYFNEIRRV